MGKAKGIFGILLGLLLIFSLMVPAVMPAVAAGYPLTNGANISILVL